MATSVLKVAFMVFFVLVICAILLVPIALMVTLEDKEEQKSTVPLSKLKKTTEEPMAKTASPTTTETSEPPPILGGGGAGLPPILGGGGAGLPPMLGGGGAGLPPLLGGGGAGLPPLVGGGGAGLPPLLGGGGAGLPPMPEISTEFGPNDNSGLQCTDIFVTGSWKTSPLEGDDGTCNPAYIGDGYCDGPCNAPDNNFDQGDCCSTSITFDYCNYDDCECYCFTEGKQYEESNMPNVVGGGGGLPPGFGGGGLPPGGGGGGLPPIMPPTITNEPPTDNSGPLTCSNTFTQKSLPPIFGGNSDELPPGVQPFSSSCNVAYIGDGYCDGGCNIPDHNFDGGDCCLSTITYTYCSYDDCECYCYPEDAQYEEFNMPNVVGGGGGGLPPIWGGGGGLPPMPGAGGAGLPPTTPPPNQNLFLCIPEPSCSISAKLMPPMPMPMDLEIGITNVTEVPVTMPAEEPLVEACNVAFIGDGFCDGPCNKLNPDNNDATTEDDWDGGDCCTAPPQWQYCNLDCCECFCYPEGIQYEVSAPADEGGDGGGDSPMIDGPPTNPLAGGQSCPENYKGDTFCDSVCNNEASGYDNGDCCLDVIKDQYCKDALPESAGCICHEDGTLHEVLVASTLQDLWG